MPKVAAQKLQRLGGARVYGDPTMPAWGSSLVSSILRKSAWRCGRTALALCSLSDCLGAA